MAKLLILSDVHYPIFPLSGIAKIIHKERPDNVLFLGDNIELDMFKKKELAYERFLSELNKVFPLSKSMLLLGDNDFAYVENKEILQLLDHFDILNKGEYFLFQIGRMHFFHGNLEKSKTVERLGYHFVLVSEKIHEKIVPFLLSNVVRFYFKIPRSDYLFLGHLHYLGMVGRTVFCGTLNRKAQYFSNSFGYVTVEHENFVPVEEGITLHHEKQR